MDALAMLKDDHDKVKKMLSDLDETTDRAEKTRTELFEHLVQALTIHETVEEEILYPALKEYAKTKDITLEAYEEHNVVDTVMAEIDQLPYDDERWGAKLTVMKENLEHHVEEEEGEMFAQCRQVFDDDELDDLGARMSARKDELEASTA
jgi:hemerythrin-like domain-containing protein